MNRTVRWLRNGLALLLLLALAAGAAWVIVQSRPRPPQVTQTSPLPTPTGRPLQPTPVPSPTPVLAATAAPIPRCSLSAASVTALPRAPSDAYVFSEPQVVLTHTAAIRSASWLPDSQRVLITRDFPQQPQEYVDILNVETQEVTPYAERHAFNAKPVWLNTASAVAYTDLAADQRIVLRLSHGVDVQPEEVVGDLASSHWAVSPDGRQVAFFSKAMEGQPQIVDRVQGQRWTLPFALPRLSQEQLYALGQSGPWQPYRAAWQPTGNRVAFYNNTGFYLADLTHKQVCEVDLGTKGGQLWALNAIWSPNGRYLALRVTGGNSRSADLMILDTVVNQVRKIDVGTYVYEVVWASDSRHLMALAPVSTQGDRAVGELFAVDIQTGSVQRALPGWAFLAGGYYLEGGGLAWSLDGRTVLVLCPVWHETQPLIVEERLCAIRVSTRSQGR